MSKSHMSAHPLSGSAIVLFVALFLAGCAGSRGAADDVSREDEGIEEEDPVAIVHADYEEFDASAFREELPEADALQHDVPDRLMEGRVGHEGTRVLEGFRIQLSQTQDPQQADELVELATEWWYMQKQAGATGTLFSGESAPVYNIWRQPYYRVRMGDFASRDAADAALQDLRVRFGGAFVVPDRVTIGP